MFYWLAHVNVMQFIVIALTEFSFLLIVSSDYLQIVDRNVVLHLKRLITNDFKDIDNHFVEVASSILYYNDLPQPDNISDWNTARHLYIFLSNCISQLVNPL